MKQFDIMVIDHAWNYNKLSNEATESDNSSKGFINYDVMTKQQRLALMPEISKIMKPDSLIYSWATWNFLPECLEVHTSNGYRYIGSAYVWVKTNKRQQNQLYHGMGRYTATSTEPCLLFARGKYLKPSQLLNQTVIAPISQHSRKPETVQARIELAYPNMDYIEVFATRPRDKWFCCGNDCSTTLDEDIFNTLRKLQTS